MPLVVGVGEKIVEIVHLRREEMRVGKVIGGSRYLERASSAWQ